MKRVVVFVLVAILASLSTVYAQDEVSVHVKTFDEKLKPLPDIRFSINGKGMLSTGSKGSAYLDIDSRDLPPASITIGSDELEAESWNYSRGTLEIIVRKKTYRVVEILARDENDKPIVNTQLTYSGGKQEQKLTDSNGSLKLLLKPQEKLSSVGDFSIPGYTPFKLQDKGDKYILIAKHVIVQQKTAEPQPQQVVQDFKNFNLKHLDSVRSLTVFYAIFKNVSMTNLKEEEKARIDKKFRELMMQMEDSIKNPRKRFLGSISDSSFVGEDIKNLVAQAEEEKEALDGLRSSFDEKIRVLNEKLAGGATRLTPEERDALIADINRLEMILHQNEEKFFKNQSSYRQLLTSLKERFFDIEELENKLQLSEAQREEEREAFQRKFYLIAAVAVCVGVLCILLIYFSNSLKKQRKQLKLANDEIQKINNNLEQLVAERTVLLEDAHREMDMFLYKASHDLRGPICSIIGLCNLAARTVNQDAQELVQMTHRTAFAMDRMLKKLKVISEINHPSNYSIVNLAVHLTEALREHRKFIQDNNITVKVQCADNIAFYSYPNLVEVIILNLVENALYFTSVKHDGNGRVSITAIADNDSVRLTVEDNGIGMKPSVQDRIWDMFFVGDEQSHGNGLGLYIVRKSLEVLNGSIAVQSEPNKYSRFIITIPVKEKALTSLPQVEKQLLIRV